MAVTVWPSFFSDFFSFFFRVELHEDIVHAAYEEYKGDESHWEKDKALTIQICRGKGITFVNGVLLKDVIDHISSDVVSEVGFCQVYCRS